MGGTPIPAFEVCLAFGVSVTTFAERAVLFWMGALASNGVITAAKIANAPTGKVTSNSATPWAWYPEESRGCPVRAKIYIETTVVSYLTARRSRDLVVAAHQQITEEWWHQRGEAFEFFISQSVVGEASAGDPEAARQRLEAVEGLDLLDITAEAEGLAAGLVTDGLVPLKAAEDALHIALATVHGIDYLVTWNCRHIANAEIRQRLVSWMLERGYELPVICTPEELPGE